jgi:imidazole glycerol-phosphate synthase subunit HisH
VIALVDYGAGNLTSVRKALTAIGASPVTPSRPEALEAATGIVVPGVGHFGATARIDAAWREALHLAMARGVAVLGICVGLQWMFEGSAESAETPGLGLFPGQCRHLATQAGSTAAPALKVPHVGWNSLDVCRESALLDGIETGDQVYFTHSYAAPLVAETVASTTYGWPFSAVVQRDRIAAVQFHPEKSGDVGLRLLRNWYRAV